MASTQEHQCKGCGLLVQPGYPRCPRCTMPLPENTSRSDAVAGGTAITQESNTYQWVGLGALCLVVAGVVYAATGNRDDKPTTAASNTVVESNDPGESAIANPSEGSDDEVGISLDVTPPTEDELREQALSSFEESLNKARLWSKLTVEDETVLSLVSGACADDNMQPTIAAAAKTLAEVGFTEIRCSEKHGEQVFEQSL